MRRSVKYRVYKMETNFRVIPLCSNHDPTENIGQVRVLDAPPLLSSSLAYLFSKAITNPLTLVETNWKRYFSSQFLIN